ncbi:MAG: FMN-binding protein [Ruminococcaceae bacterium]|nr:FMN-binding protein [Oscillospiraceae bacterium]
MKTFGSILLSVLALTLIAAVATAALAGTNALTKDIIAENNAATADAARRTVFSAAEAFEERTLTADGDTVTYHAALKGGEVIGYVFTAVSTGKSAGLVVMTGVDTSGTVTGVAVTEDSETAGYIAKVTDGGLFETLKGRQNTDGVDTVSQATKTSKGILKGVDKALEYFAHIG